MSAFVGVYLIQLKRNSSCRWISGFRRFKSTTLRNVGNQSPSETSLHPIGTESSNCVLWGRKGDSEDDVKVGWVGLGEVRVRESRVA